MHSFILIILVYTDITNNKTFRNNHFYEPNTNRIKGDVIRTWMRLIFVFIEDNYLKLKHC